MKTWMILALLAGIFTILGAAGVVAAVLTREWVLLASLAVLVIGLVMAWFTPATRREQSGDEVAAPVAVPGVMPFEQVAERLRERLDDTPYAVELTGSRIMVHADLADAAFLTWAGAHRVSVVRGIEIYAKAPGSAITRDFEQDLELNAGVGLLTGNARVQSGRTWSYERRTEFGVGADGSVGKQVDVRFSSKELRGPVNEVLQETGWYTGFMGSLPAEAKVGLIVGVIAGIGAVVIGVVTLVAQLV